MVLSIGKILIGCFAIILAVSCAKLPDYTIVEDKILAMEIEEVGDSIPLKWEKLISVSNVSRYGDWVQLWFQDEEGTIFMVPYGITDNKFAVQYRVLHRK
ncbi:MAG: hypothetical protein RRA35_10245 [Desulfomonilia bacterium]|nr:hypothetical protein [Desulfomonilia bacterium]